LNKLVQKRLGRKALSVQAEQGRGAWVATDGNQFAFVRVAALPGLFIHSSHNDFQSLLKMVIRFNPTKQVVILFNPNQDSQIIATVDIEQYDYE
jgi:hypothetical protein